MVFMINVSLRPQMKKKNKLDNISRLVCTGQHSSLAKSGEGGTMQSKLWPLDVTASQNLPNSLDLFLNFSLVLQGQSKSKNSFYHSCLISLDEIYSQLRNILRYFNKRVEYQFIANSATWMKSMTWKTHRHANRFGTYSLLHGLMQG